MTSIVNNSTDLKPVSNQSFPSASTLSSWTGKCNHRKITTFPGVTPQSAGEKLVRIRMFSLSLTIFLNTVVNYF